MTKTETKTAESAPTLFAVADKSNATLHVVDIERVDIPDVDAIDTLEVERLASNIERVGLIHQPVVLKSGARYTVITGRRRVAALKMLSQRETEAIAEQHEKTPDRVIAPRYASIECYVRTEKKTSAEDIAAIVLSENAARSANVLGELRSINVFIDAGKDAKTIAESTGQHISWVRHRLILNKLVPSAMKLFETGRMRFETAQRLARLDAAHQKTVVESFRAKRKERGDDAVLAMNDISVATSRPVVELPGAMFAPMPSVEPTPRATSTDAVLRERGIAPEEATVKQTIDAMQTAEERAIAAMPSAKDETIHLAYHDDGTSVMLVDESTSNGVELSAADALAKLSPVARLSVIAGALEPLAALMPDVASRDAIKRARSRVIVGRDALSASRTK